MATLNILTLTVKEEELIETMTNRKLNILGLGEWKEKETRALKDEYQLYWSGEENYGGYVRSGNSRRKDNIRQVEIPEKVDEVYKPHRSDWSYK